MPTIAAPNDEPVPKNVPGTDPVALVETLPANAAGGAATAGAPLPNPELDKASQQAINAHLSATGPKKRGPKRQQFPASGPASGPGGGPQDGSASLAASQAAPVPAPVVPVPPEDIEAIAKEAVKALDGLSSMVTKYMAGQRGATPETIKKIGELSKMPAETSNLLKMGAMGTAKKYGANMQYAPEAALVLGLIGWTTSQFLVVIEIQKLSAPPKPA